jgi:tRNA nucleotidyltransferase/poly(A) polymerase
MEDVKFANEVELAEKIAIEVHKENGCTYYVGGYVRDSILGREK